MPLMSLDVMGSKFSEFGEFSEFSLKQLLLAVVNSIVVVNCKLHCHWCTFVRVVGNRFSCWSRTARLAIQNRKLCCVTVTGSSASLWNTLIMHSFTGNYSHSSCRPAKLPVFSITCLETQVTCLMKITGPTSAYCQRYSLHGHMSEEAILGT